MLRNSNISKKSKVCIGCNLHEVTMDNYSYIGEMSRVTCCSIGKFCSISNNCIIGGGEHPLEFVSTSPIFLKGVNVLRHNFSNHDYAPHSLTVIENDVWIGAGVTIKSGIKISNGAVIGMGAVVTKNVGPYEVWGGNPARMIKKRFDDETIRELLRTKWWDKEDGIIQMHSETMNNPDLFLEKWEEI